MHRRFGPRYDCGGGGAAAGGSRGDPLGRGRYRGYSAEIDLPAYPSPDSPLIGFGGGGGNESGYTLNDSISPTPSSPMDPESSHETEWETSLEERRAEENQMLRDHARRDAAERTWERQLLAAGDSAEADLNNNAPFLPLAELANLPLPRINLRDGAALDQHAAARDEKKASRSPRSATISDAAKQPSLDDQLMQSLPKLQRAATDGIYGATAQAADQANEQPQHEPAQPEQQPEQQPAAATFQPTVTSHHWARKVFDKAGAVVRQVQERVMGTREVASEAKTNDAEPSAPEPTAAGSNPHEQGTELVPHHQFELKAEYSSLPIHLAALLLDGTPLSLKCVKAIVHFTGATEQTEHCPWIKLPNAERNRSQRASRWDSPSRHVVDELKLKAWSIHDRWVADTVTLAFRNRRLIYNDLFAVNAQMKRDLNKLDLSNGFAPGHPENGEKILGFSHGAREVNQRERAMEIERGNEQNFLITFGLIPPHGPQYLPAKQLFQHNWHSNIQLADAPDTNLATLRSLLGQEFLYVQPTATCFNFVGPHAVFSVCKLFGHGSRVISSDNTRQPTVKLDGMDFAWNSKEERTSLELD